jgi:hypothetical protein
MKMLLFLNYITKIKKERPFEYIRNQKGLNSNLKIQAFWIIIIYASKSLM